MHWQRFFYNTNTRSFFSIVGQDYNIVNELTYHILSGQFCCIDECSIYMNNKFGKVKSSCLIIDFTKSKYTKPIINLSKSKVTTEIRM